jgi:hypothetical protein
MSLYRYLSIGVNVEYPANYARQIASDGLSFQFARFRSGQARLARGGPRDL